MRCGNEVPSCTNCRAYNERCVYDAGPKKPRPSNSRIRRLEEENRNLQARLAQQTGNTLNPQAAGYSQPDSKTSEARIETDDSSSASTSSDESDAEGASPEYHGPSSVFYDDGIAGGRRRTNQEPEGRSNPPPFKLTAEAAAQRELGHVL